MGEPTPQGLRRDVDELDLRRPAHHFVGHGLPLFDAGDLCDHVVEAFKVLDVHRRDHRDAGVEKFLDVHPALGVLAARCVGVRQLVDEDDLWPAGQHSRYVKLGEGAAAVFDMAWRDDLDTVEQFGGLLAAVRLDHCGNQIGAALQPPVCLTEHRECLAHARGGTQVNAQLASSRLVAG